MKNRTWLAVGEGQAKNCPGGPREEPEFHYSSAMLVWDIPTHLSMENYTLILWETEMTVKHAETLNQKQGKVAFSPHWSVMCQQCCIYLPQISEGISTS